MGADVPGESLEWEASRLRGALDVVGEVALAAVVAVEVVGHEHAGTAVLVRALLAQLGDLARLVDLVVAQHSQLHGLVLVLHLLGGGVVLLLVLLATAQHIQVDLVAAALGGLSHGGTASDQALGRGGDALHGSHGGLHNLGVAAGHIEAQRPAGGSLHENLHVAAGVTTQRKGTQRSALRQSRQQQRDGTGTGAMQAHCTAAAHDAQTQAATGSDKHAQPATTTRASCGAAHAATTTPIRASSSDTKHIGQYYTPGKKQLLRLIVKTEETKEKRGQR